MMQEQGPVVEMDGTHLVTSASGIEEVFKHPEVYSSAVVYKLVMGAPVPLVPLEFDPPELLRYRRLLAPFFSPGVIARMNDGLRTQVREIIEPIAARGHCDVVPELAVPYPGQVFLTLLGLPLADRDRLFGWKNAVIGAADPTATGRPNEEVVQEFVVYLQERIAERKGQSGDDLLTRVVNDPSPDALNDEELLGMVYLLVNAGLDTVTSTLALAFARLAGDPELRAALAADRSRIPSFVEETVRLDPVAAFTPRTTTQDTTLEGQFLPAGAMVSLALAVANRDPEVYEDPTRLDLDRGGHHWGFGGGPHRCLGSHLARAELRLVFEEWFAAIPDFEFEEGFEPVMPWPLGLLTMTSVRLTFPPTSH
jgi:cytochrome P450